MDERIDGKDLEKEFMKRNETLRSFYHTEALELSDDEVESLTPILNSLKSDMPRYREIDRLAEGGEKKVTLVHDHRLDRRVAMARSVRSNNPQDLEQFLREARLTANLAHPNIMPVYNMGLDENGEPFFSMELVPGDSLKSIIGKLRDGDEPYRKSYTLKVLLDIFVKVCDAIAYAHSRNVLHLDIKPDNIRVGAFGEVLVCDWGLARVMHATEDRTAEDTNELDADVLNDMTLSGTLKGTPGFMAPEQTQAYGEKTCQTDIYALGALLYMMLAYRLPVEGESAHEVIQNTREGRLVPIRRRKTDRHIPVSLVAVAMKALALDPADRYESVLELGNDIGRHLSGHPTHAEHAGWITRTSLLLQRHSRVAFLLITFLLVLAFVIGGNLVAISHQKAVAVEARKTAEANFALYQREQEVSQSLGEDLGEAVLYTVRSRDFVNAPSMIQLLETGLNENFDTVKRQNLYEQKGILHFVLEEFNAANVCFDAAGSTKRIEPLIELSHKYAEIKPNDSRRLSDDQLAALFNESKAANQMTLFYLYYHHMRRRPASASPESYVLLAGAVLDRLNYSHYARNNPLKLEEHDGNYSLNLSNAPYTVFSINIIGVYRRNILTPFKLKSLDISHTRIEDFNELRGMKLDELRMVGVPLRDRGRAFLNQMDRFKLKRIVLDASEFPKETIEELGGKMEVVDAGGKDDAKAKSGRATQARRADAGSQESTAP